MLTKQITIDKIEVTENSAIQVRTATRILEDEKVLTQTYHRHCLSPGDDLAGQDKRVRAVAKAVWTKEVVDEFKKRAATT